MKKILLAIILISAFSSCKIAHSFIELHKKSAKVYSYKAGSKEIRFVPMHHLGKKEFYDDVKRIITENKNDGYRVYYELISTDFTKDSLLKDTIRRKVRKLKEFNGTYKENAQGSFFKKFIQQPAYPDLGTDDKDLRADVNYLEMGKNKRNNCTGQHGSAYSVQRKISKKLFYTKKQYNKIFIEYRNNYLIHLITTNPDNKILIIYGAGHRKEFKKSLKKANLS